MTNPVESAIMKYYAEFFKTKKAMADFDAKFLKNKPYGEVTKK